MRKRILAYGPCTLGLLLLLGYLFFLPGPGISLWNYYQISSGMHAKEVETLLGGPDRGPQWMSGQPIMVPDQGWIERWKSDHIVITLVYDKHSRLAFKDWEIYRHEPLSWESLLRIIRRERIRE